MSDMVTYGTRCPEWTYIDKYDDIKLFRVSYLALVWSIKAIFEPLVAVPFNSVEICQILSYVVQDA